MALRWSPSLEGVPRFQCMFNGRFRRSLRALTPRLFLFVLDAARRLSIWLLLPLLASGSVSICLSPQPSDAPAVGRIGWRQLPFLLPFSRGGAVIFRVAARWLVVRRWRIGFHRSLIPHVRIRTAAAFGFLILMTIAGCWSTPCARGGEHKAAVVVPLPSAQWAQSLCHQARMSPVAVAQRCQLGLHGQCPASCSQAIMRRRPKTANTSPDSAGLHEGAAGNLPSPDASARSSVLSPTAKWARCLS